MPRTALRRLARARLDIRQRLQAGGGRYEHGRGHTEAGAHDGHVAGVVDDTLFLFECRLVLLVDHHQAKIGERQEQCRTGYNHHGCFPLGHRAPGATAGAGGEVGMPDRGRHAEPAMLP
jgi:hypothetical protein